MTIAATLDGTGLYGTLLHTAFAAAFFGSAALIFFQLWRRGRLDMDEDAAIQMLKSEELPQDGTENR